MSSEADLTDETCVDFPDDSGIPSVALFGDNRKTVYPSSEKFIATSRATPVGCRHQDIHGCMDAGMIHTVCVPEDHDSALLGREHPAWGYREQPGLAVEDRCEEAFQSGQGGL